MIVKHTNRVLIKSFLIFGFVYYGYWTYAQESSDISILKKTLEAIRERDQKTRTGKDSAEFVHYIDSTNLVEMEAIISRYGWPGKSLVGSRGNQSCFLVIQHADSAAQVKYLPVMQKSVEQGESSMSDFALLQDRVLMRQEKKQIYGSQVVFDKQGNPEFYPIEDEKNVNIRRKEAGLEPIEQYAKYFNIEYNPPEE